MAKGKTTAKGATKTAATADDDKAILSAQRTDDGKGAYGTRHVMEEEMRAAGQGVFAKAAK